MFAAYNAHCFGLTSKNSSKNLDVNVTKNQKKHMVISPILTKTPFSIPDSPEYMTVESINKIDNIYVLKKLEYEYDNFLEKKYQILMLLNNIDEVFDVREALIMRIIVLKRDNRHKRKLNNINIS